MILGGQRDFALGGQTRAAFPITIELAQHRTYDFTALALF